MTITDYGFGQIKIDGEIYKHDIVIDHGQILARDKTPSDSRKTSWHTPLSTTEYIPWNCQTLYIGTGESGAMEVLPEIIEEAKKRKITLLIDTTPKIVQRLGKGVSNKSNVILHLTC